MKVMEFIIYKTMLKVSNECVLLCVAIEPIDKIIPRIHMSVKRSMIVLNYLFMFIHELSTKYGKKKQSISTDRGPWHPQAL